MTYACPCCRYLTLSEEPPGTFEICSVCYWEDDNVQFNNPDYPGGANRVSLNEARENYRCYGASTKADVAKVRKPKLDELIIIQEVVDGLIELSDKNVQERLWLHGSNIISSFEEAVCGIFDDGGITRALDRKELEPHTRDLFIQLSKLVAKIPHNLSPRENINHPAMLQVSQVSNMLLKILQK